MTECVLNGFRALELTDEKGFLCGKILADLGVDVIKIEKPGGDSDRNIPPFYHDETSPEKSLYWFSYNTNKRGITLNIETKQGQDLFKRLVGKSDFVIESFPPGYMAELGLDYSKLAEINPVIIMTSITDFGQSGPYSNFKGSDLVDQALGAILIQHGDPDRAPLRVSVPQAYLNACTDAAEGTMIAHYYRGITGKGQHVDVSVMDSVTWCGHLAVPIWDATKTVTKRAGNLMFRGGHYTPNVWPCKDGYVAFQILGSTTGASTNQNLTAWMDSEQMAPQYMKEKDWENFDFVKTTPAEMESLMEAIGHFFKSHTKDELHEEALKRNVMLYKVSDSADTINSAQLKAREFWVSLEHKELDNTITYPGAFAKFSLTPIQIQRRPPLIGEYNEEIYEKELGLSKDELAALKASGII